MKYFYRCGKVRDECCKISDASDEVFDEHTVVLPKRMVELMEDGSVNEKQTPLILEIAHPMIESPEVLCPVCGYKAIRLIIKAPQAYFRGYGYLDKAGCHRDMNLFKLQQDDPYGYMREAGEADHMADQIKKKGKFDPKPKHFVPKKDGSGYHRKDNTINK